MQGSAFGAPEPFLYVAALAPKDASKITQENPALHKALIAGGAGETVRAGILRHTAEVISRTRISADPGLLDDLLLVHLISASLNLLAWWLKNLDQVDAESMAEIIERHVLTPVSSLRRMPPGARAACPDGP